VADAAGNPALACGLAFANLCANDPNPGRFLQIIDDAEVCLEPGSNAALVTFVNQLVRLVNTPAPTTDFVD
jgi:hypothetical protein